MKQLLIFLFLLTILASCENSPQSNDAQIQTSVEIPQSSQNYTYCDTLIVEDTLVEWVYMTANCFWGKQRLQMGDTIYPVSKEGIDNEIAEISKRVKIPKDSVKIKQKGCTYEIDGRNSLGGGVQSTLFPKNISLHKRGEKAYKQRIPASAHLISRYFKPKGKPIVFDTIVSDTTYFLKNGDIRKEIFKHKNHIIENNINMAGATKFKRNDKVLIELPGYTLSLAWIGSELLHVEFNNSAYYFLIYQGYPCNGSFCTHNQLYVIEKKGETYKLLQNSITLQCSYTWHKSHTFGDFNEDGQLDCISVSLSESAHLFRAEGLTAKIEVFTFTLDNRIIPLTDAKGAPYFIEGIPKITRDERFSYSVTDSLYVVKSNWFEPLR